MGMNLSKLQDKVKDRGAWLAIAGSQRVRHDLVAEQQQQKLDVMINSRCHRRSGNVHGTHKGRGQNAIWRR